jgi:hypothetical protein
MEILLLKKVRVPTEPTATNGTKHGRCIASPLSKKSSIRKSKCVWRPASHGRQETSREFAYGRDWNGTVYATKRVRPVFVEKPTEIVVITVYTYFF